MQGEFRVSEYHLRDTSFQITPPYSLCTKLDIICCKCVMLRLTQWIIKSSFCSKIDRGVWNYTEPFNLHLQKWFWRWHLRFYKVRTWKKFQVARTQIFFQFWNLIFLSGLQVYMFWSSTFKIWKGFRFAIFQVPSGIEFTYLGTYLPTYLLNY